MHGKQPIRHARVWHNVGCKGWSQAIGNRAPKKTSLKNRQAETLPEVLTAGYSGMLLNATKRSHALAKIDKAAREHLSRPRLVRIVKGF